MKLEAFGACMVALALLPLPGLAASCPAYLQFLEPHCAEWQSDILPADLPPARGNTVADRQDAAVLGMKIFYDNRFSRPGAGVWSGVAIPTTLRRGIRRTAERTGRAR